MEPTSAVELSLFVIEEAIKAEPVIAKEIQTLLAKADPTPADWAALRARVKAKSYGDYVPDSSIPVGGA